MKKILAHVAITISILLINSCYVGRFVYWNFADVKDYRKFAKVEFSKSENPYHFKTSTTSSVPDTVTYNNVPFKLDDFVEQNKSLAFLIIRNDSILYEKYFDKYNAGSVVPSFSMAKSFTSILLGIAIDEGYIKSVSQSVTDFIPELLKKDTCFKEITIEHLLDMKSGIAYKEQYANPFGNVTRDYYGRNLWASVMRLHIEEKPGKTFHYASINSQILAFIIERATGKKLPDYFKEKLWEPLGMEYEGSWSLDSKKYNHAKAFCCVNATARDFAKIGKLYLDQGKWNGKQIISEKWIKQSLDFNRSISSAFYSYQWWHYAPGDFYAQGYLGQFIYVCPSKKIIIVRLGKSKNIHWPSFFSELCDVL